MKTIKFEEPIILGDNLSNGINDYEKKKIKIQVGTVKKAASLEYSITEFEDGTRYDSYWFILYGQKNGMKKAYSFDMNFPANTFEKTYPVVKEIIKKFIRSIL